MSEDYDDETLETEEELFSSDDEAWDEITRKEMLTETDDDDEEENREKEELSKANAVDNRMASDDEYPEEIIYSGSSSPRGKSFRSIINVSGVKMSKTFAALAYAEAWRKRNSNEHGISYTRNVFRTPGVEEKGWDGKEEVIHCGASTETNTASACVSEIASSTRTFRREKPQYRINGVVPMSWD